MHRYATLTAVATFLLLIAGALVTSTDSGLAVPDWPLSYGTWFPPMVGGILYEHGHRMIAGVVGLMIAALAIWLARGESRRWVRRLGFIALAGVVVQALLGGLTVLWLLPPQISITHACLGQAVFCAVVILARVTAPGWRTIPQLHTPAAPRLQQLTLMVVALAVAQLVLGAVIRHTGHAVAWHIGAAGALAASAVVLAWAARREGPLSRPREVWKGALRLAGLVALQGALGLAVFAHRGSVLARTLHVAIGALVLGQAVLLVIAAHRTRARRFTGVPDYLELTKARLSLLVVLTTAVGFWLGLRDPQRLGLLAPVCLGTALVVGGANALNQWMEREADARMHRTRSRPLPSGRMRPETAFRFGLGVSIIGLLVLGGGVNLLSAVIALTGWISYLFLYTPLKRRTALCTLVGAIPGAVPPLIGWAGARGEVTVEAWALFFLVFIWQLPHFLSLAVLYRDDYLRAGFPMLPAIDSTGWVTARQMILYGLALIPVSLFPASMGLVGGAYFYGAMLLGLGFLAVTVRAAWSRSPQSAQQLFRASVLYLPVVLVLLAWDRRPL